MPTDRVMKRHNNLPYNQLTTTQPSNSPICRESDILQIVDQSLEQAECTAYKLQCCTDAKLGRNYTDYTSGLSSEFPPYRTSFITKPAESLIQSSHNNRPEEQPKCIPEDHRSIPGRQPTTNQEPNTH
ncbi:hypothetical protein HYC85_006358 [Camellia sinensis]|uniref:Uncharacterized protein n=1 Tax=Camellia sinensis TaxID=4442 RepID=A0A7J7HKR6_CAMSI|nr:hypothetical protein HYC85_006358 [Camellia sinensis]